MEHGLHMNGGNAETSYANNSSLQRKAIQMTKPIRERAITELCAEHCQNTICIADLGCGCGSNTLLASSEIVEAIYNAKINLGEKPPEIQVFLNDLPGNDFNTLFKLLAQLQQGSDIRPSYNGVPGSFYHRLFPAETLHFVQVSYGLHWLSQVPAGIRKSNKGNICVANTSSTSVVEAYYNQFHKDFSMFLKHRFTEMVPGGRMVLTMLGRGSQDPRENDFILYQLLAEALNDLVSEGLLDEEKLESFNIPNYMPSPSEIESLVEEEGSFIIDHLECFEIHWNAHRNGSSSRSSTLKEVGYSVAKAIRSVLEPLFLDHFQEGMLDEMFGCRYQNKIIDYMAIHEKTVHSNIVVSLKKNNYVEGSAGVKY